MRSLTNDELNALETLQSTKGRDNLRVAIYARKSAEDERQTSLPTQIAECTQFISQYNSLKLERVFQEDNVSGMFIQGRTEYLKMMELAERGEIDVIVVMKLDRLSRDLADSTTTIKLLRSYDIMLIAGDDISYSDTPVGELLRNILLAQNQYFARRTASDVLTVLCNNATNGLSAGGVAPYGLKVVNKQFEIDETEAPAVRMMFEMVSKGNSYQQVIKALASQGFLTRAKTKFSYSTINSMLSNPKYYGTYIYNSKSTPRRAKRVVIDKIDEVCNTEAIPPIITKDLFDKVQAILLKRQAGRPRQNANPEFVLTGLLYCKVCGCSLSGDSSVGGRNHRRYRVYKHTSKQHKSCGTKPINADYIELAVKQMITDSINQYLANYELSSDIFKQLESKVRNKIDYTRKNVELLEQKANRFLEMSISCQPTLVSKYQAKASEFFETKQVNEDRLLVLQGKLEAYKALKDVVKTESIISIDDIFTDYKTTREIINFFISKIEIDDEHDTINIIFNTEEEN